MSTGAGVRVPPTTDPRWSALVSNGTTLHLKVLALQLMLTRVKWQVKADPSPATLKKKVDELAEFFAKNSRKLEADTIALFG